MGSIPGQGINIPQSLWPKNKQKEKKRRNSKFNKDFLKNTGRSYFSLHCGCKSVPYVNNQMRAHFWPSLCFRSSRIVLFPFIPPANLVSGKEHKGLNSLAILQGNVSSHFRAHISIHDIQYLMGKLSADGTGTQLSSLHRAEALSSHFAIFQHWWSAELGMVLAWDGNFRLISLKEHDIGIFHKQDRNSMGRYQESHSHLKHSYTHDVLWGSELYEGRRAWLALTHYPDEKTEMR